MPIVPNDRGNPAGMEDRVDRRANDCDHLKDEYVVLLVGAHVDELASPRRSGWTTHVRPHLRDAAVCQDDTPGPGGRPQRSVGTMEQRTD